MCGFATRDLEEKLRWYRQKYFLCRSCGIPLRSGGRLLGAVIGSPAPLVMFLTWSFFGGIAALLVCLLHTLVATGASILFGAPERDMRLETRRRLAQSVENATGHGEAMRHHVERAASAVRVRIRALRGRTEMGWE